MIKDGLNPWAGLASYEDPETAEHKLKFCGRDDDIFDVTKLVVSNVFVTLYGKSGIGKTSLLNAGVFPELREEGYMPVNIRLGIRDEQNPKCFQKIIIDIIEQTVKRTETIDVIPEQNDIAAADYLWNYFARHRFYDKNNEPTLPVIVLDQFEEVFRNGRDEAEVLLRQLDYMNDKDHVLDSCNIDGVSYGYEQNFRFVVSIREDDLYRLEDSLDNSYLPALKRNRFRLRSLSEEDARKVILIPGEGLFCSKEEDTIVKRVIGATRQKGDDGISTNLLSLICNRLYNDRKSAGSEYITGSFVESFMKENPIEKFYNEATKGFTDREKAYIEDHLVDSAGRRNSISESDFYKNVPGGGKLLEGDTRILQRISASSDGTNYRIELIHDSFCEPLVGQKEKRDKSKRRRHLIVMACVALISILTFSYIAYTNWEMLKNRARFVAEKGMELIGNSDSYTARLLALEVLPQNLKFPTRPYVPEAERLLRNAINRDDAMLEHNDKVSSASFSPDGSRIVSASNDNAIRIWDTSNGALLQVLEGHTSYVSSASFSADGSRIVSSSWDGTVCIWDASTGIQLHVLRGHKFVVNSASFSTDGSRIVSASWDNTVCVWDASNGTQLQVFDGHTVNVNSASFSPDGSRIVSASHDGTILIWDAYTGVQLHILDGHTSPINSVSFSPDGSRIVSASEDETIRIWDAFTGVQLNVLKGHTFHVTSASYSPDGRRIVSASIDGTVRIWNASNGDLLRIFEGHRSVAYSASFSPDGDRIVSAWDNTVRILDTSTGVQFHVLDGHISVVNSATFSPDGSRIVSASHDGTIRIWDAYTGVQLHSLDGHTDWVNFVTFSPDGRRIVSASSDGTVRIWDTSNGALFQVLEGHTSTVSSATFSPDGRRIVSASSDGTVRIWDAFTGVQLNVLEGHRSVVNSATFSPDGSLIVSASADETICIWDAYTGSQLHRLYGHTSPINSVSFSPDGRRIVSASDDETIRIWDASIGAQLNVLKGHTFPVTSASYSPDGRRIVSASWDNTFCVWDAYTGVQLHSLDGHTDWVNSVTFSPDGRRIVSASRDGTVRIWDFPPLQNLINQTREQFKNRRITPEERQKFHL